MTESASLSGISLYLDSNVFIYAFEGRDGALRNAASQLVRGVFTGEHFGHTSVLTRAEVLVRPSRQRQTELADRYRRLLSDAGPVKVESVGSRVADLTAELRADYPSLKLPDALHLATAIHTDCGAFITGDKRLTVVSARIPVVMLDQISG